MSDHDPYRPRPAGRPDGAGHPPVPAGPSGHGGPADPGGHGDRTSTRRRPTWPALVGTAAGAAILASVVTLGASQALDDDASGGTTPTRAAVGAGTSDRSDTADASDPSDAEPAVTSTTETPDWVDLASTVGPTVVAIDVRTPGGTGAGSGVIADDDGRIVTNHHVVGGAVPGGIVVTLSDGRMFAATVVGTDPPTDLAVITLDEPPADLEAAAFGDSEDVRVGDPVAAIGNPLGLSHTVTTGIVSALDRPVTTSEPAPSRGEPVTPATTNAIQVDAPINPGNSGGPLFDARGRVIGINSSIASMPTGAGGSAGSIGLGFAIPSNLTRLITDQLAQDGTAEHAYLGVSLGDAVTSLGQETRSGAQVRGVEPGTPAEEAGLRPGDVVVAVDGSFTTGAESLTGFIRQYASGESVTLTVARDGEALEVQATLATREDRLP